MKKLLIGLITITIIIFMAINVNASNLQYSAFELYPVNNQELTLKEKEISYNFTLSPSLYPLVNQKFKINNPNDTQCVRFGIPININPIKYDSSTNEHSVKLKYNNVEIEPDIYIISDIEKFDIKNYDFHEVISKTEERLNLINDKEVYRYEITCPKGNDYFRGSILLNHYTKLIYKTIEPTKKNDLFYSISTKTEGEKINYVFYTIGGQANVDFSNCIVEKNQITIQDMIDVDIDQYYRNIAIYSMYEFLTSLNNCCSLDSLWEYTYDYLFYTFEMNVGNGDNLIDLSFYSDYDYYYAQISNTYRFVSSPNNVWKEVLSSKLIIQSNNDINCSETLLEKKDNFKYYDLLNQKIDFTIKFANTLDDMKYSKFINLFDSIGKYILIIALPLMILIVGGVHIKKKNDNDVR